jgi:predicted RNase H-like nuclease
VVERIVGVDGCRAGWLACYQRDNQIQICLYAGVSDLASALPDSRIFIDMPIGLPESEKRPVEKKARSLLGRRACCVFSVPSRSAVYAESYQASCAANLLVQGVKLSKQTWNLCSKIKQLDQFIRGGGSKLDFYEAHPELVFCILNGSPLTFRKQSVQGQQQRIKLLSRAGLPVMLLLEEVSRRYRRSQVAIDDILDAMVLFVLSRFDPVPLLDQTIVDEYGIPANMMVPATRLVDH